jgi:hypothetical protein
MTEQSIQTAATGLRPTYDFSLDEFTIADTRSPHEDTDYAVANLSVKEANGNVVDYGNVTRSYGNVNNGRHPMRIGWRNVLVPTGAMVSITFVITNAGHDDAILTKLGPIIQTVAKGVVGHTTGVFPKSWTDWAIDHSLGLIFANCDGWVAGDTLLFAQASLPPDREVRHGSRFYPGKDSSVGCGSNSRYYVAYSWHAGAAVIATPFDLNGRWTAGGTAGPVISVSGNVLTIDMSAYHRPAASGFIIDGQTINVTFPDDATYSGTLHVPGTIKWSNGTAWTKASNKAIPESEPNARPVTPV